MRLKLHKAKMEVFPITFIFSLDKKRIEASGNFTIDEGAAGASYLDGLNVYMWLEHEDFGVVIPHLTHEAFHCAMFAADTLGIEPTLTAHEECAYMAGWFSGKVLDFVNSDAKVNDGNKTTKKRGGK